MAGRLVGRARPARARRLGRARRDGRQARRPRRDHRRDATSSGSSPTSASSGAAAITVTIYQSNKAAECQYILADSGARFVFCDTDRPGREDPRGAGQAPGARGHHPRDRARAADGFERTLADLERPGAEWRARTPTRTRRGSRPSARTIPRASSTPRARPATRRASSSPTANWVYEGERGRAAPDHRRGRPRPHVPADGPLVREGDRGGLVRHRRDRARSSSRMEKIIDNASEVRPTVMPSVPRIFEKAYNTVVSKGLATPGPQGQALPLAMESFDAVRRRGASRGRSYSSFGFAHRARSSCSRSSPHALNERFGGRMRLFVSGGAPLSPKIAHFFDVLGFTILEGYGLTESSAGTFVNRPGPEPDRHRRPAGARDARSGSPRTARSSSRAAG